jgi:outer membrane protein OmpA-like peptidoglycan-associated protein
MKADKQKKVSLDKQPAVESVAVLPPLAPKKKISLNKQIQKTPALAPADPAVIPSPPAVSAPSGLSAPGYNSAPPVSKPISTIPVSSATVPVAESIRQGGVRPATDAGYKKEGASSARKIVGIIIVSMIIISILFLWRNCGSKKQAPGASASQTEFVQPLQETSRDPELSPTQKTVQGQASIRQPESIPDLELPKQETSESSNLPVLTYDAFYFMGDSNSFLPGLNYEERLSATVQDMKNILKVNPGQIFLISGYSADIPGHDQGEMELSTQRANRVRNSLVQLGVPQANLECVYRGSTSKWGDNISETTRSLNRVVTIELKT